MITEKDYKELINEGVYSFWDYNSKEFEEHLKEIIKEKTGNDKYNLKMLFDIHNKYKLNYEKYSYEKLIKSLYREIHYEWLKYQYP